MNEKQIRKSIRYTEIDLTLLKLNMSLNTVYFQQIGVVVSNFQGKLLYNFIIEILSTTDDDYKRAISDENILNNTNSLLNKFEIIVEKSLNSKLTSDAEKYFETIANTLFQLQPKYLKKSNHSKIRFVKSHKLYIIECIANLIISKCIYTKAYLGNQILRYYSCPFSTEPNNQLYLRQDYSILKLMTIKKYLEKALDTLS